MLGELAAQVPLPIPVPKWVGEPSEEFRWPFYGAEVIDGRELPAMELDHDARCALGRPLGRFLRALHDASVTAELPYDPMERANMTIARAEDVRGAAGDRRASGRSPTRSATRSTTRSSSRPASTTIRSSPTAICTPAIC